MHLGIIARVTVMPSLIYGGEIVKYSRKSPSHVIKNYIHFGWVRVTYLCHLAMAEGAGMLIPWHSLALE